VQYETRGFSLQRSIIETYRLHHSNLRVITAGEILILLLRASALVVQGVFGSLPPTHRLIANVRRDPAIQKLIVLTAIQRIPNMGR
jgi:hypothetical protein